MFDYVLDEQRSRNLCLKNVWVHNITNEIQCKARVSLRVFSKLHSMFDYVLDGQRPRDLCWTIFFKYNTTNGMQSGTTILLRVLGKLYIVCSHI